MLAGWAYLDHAARGLAAETNAVGNADAVVGVAGEVNAGQHADALLDALHALLVADRVLRHGAAPAVDLCELRLDVGADDARAEDFAEFAENGCDEHVVG